MSKQAKLQNSMQKYTFYEITQKTDSARMTSPQSKGRKIPKITMK
jgi:hypothetical protein